MNFPSIKLKVTEIKKMNSVNKIKVFKLKIIKNAKGNVLRAFRETDKFAGKSEYILAG